MDGPADMGVPLLDPAGEDEIVGIAPVGQLGRDIGTDARGRQLAGAGLFLTANLLPPLAPLLTFARNSSPPEDPQGLVLGLTLAQKSF
jgi:hypothetical protein